MNVYEKVQTMTKEEFSAWCCELYNKGWFDGKDDIDDELWVRHNMADSNFDDWNEVE